MSALKNSAQRSFIKELWHLIRDTFKLSVQDQNCSLLFELTFRRGIRLRGRKQNDTADPPAEAEEDEEDKKGGEGEEEREGRKEEKRTEEEEQLDSDDCEVCPGTETLLFVCTA